jgi:DNA-binding MarR family transcriptional regulator
MKNMPLVQYPDPSNFAGFLVWQSANAWEKYLNSKLAPTGLNQSEMLHLISIFHLLQSQNELNQSQLAEYTGVTAMSVSKIIKKLQSMDFIERKTGSDPRSKSISVTTNGFVLLQDCTEILRLADVEFFQKPGKSSLISYLQKR